MMVQVHQWDLRCHKNLILQKGLTYFGYMMRANGLEKRLIFGKIKGKRRRLKNSNELAGRDEGNYQDHNDNTNSHLQLQFGQGNDHLPLHTALTEPLKPKYG
ncbi:hypothetical protein LAZ67_14002061 [Cordylochernes scorpioides]|uniref:Uncharacterized protein n=1 Tax=Cordylochernes scorpioides TaxID=51811 RepID=A0ABY6L6L8_9ARAC|nr:hypothetical protein LAZ67_14002061 [Cordylochernes scorpioides]